MRTKTIDTYEIDKKGNRVHDGAVKRTFVDEKNNFAKIEYTKGKNYIRKVKENGRWYLDDLAYNADIAYSRAFERQQCKNITSFKNNQRRRIKRNEPQI